MGQQTGTTPKRPALYEIHALRGAKFLSIEGQLLPAYFTDPIAENLAVRRNVGIIDLSQREYLRVAGSDRASFMQGITTNDVGNIMAGDGLHCAILTVKGRVLADFILLAFEDHFLLEMEASILEKLRTTLSRYKIREKVMIEQGGGIGAIGVQGPDSPLLIAKNFTSPLPELRTYHHFTVQSEQSPITIRKESLTGEAGYILTMPQTSLQRVWENLLKMGTEFNLHPIGYEAMESLRIEAGIPRYGLDLTEENIPLEIENEDIISFTKGCYVGQEVIARLKFLGQANKHLKGLLLAGAKMPKYSARIVKDEKEIGRVTSSAYSPTLNQGIAMAYLRREYSAAGTQVTVESEGGGLQATATDLPFIRR